LAATAARRNDVLHAPIQTLRLVSSTAAAPNFSITNNKMAEVGEKSGKALASALRFPQRKSGPTKKRTVPGKDQWSVVGYSTADTYDLAKLSKRLYAQGLYEMRPLPEDLGSSCLYVVAKYKVDDTEQETRDIFFFEHGCVVFWNVPELERDNVLGFLKPDEMDSYSEEVISDESEMLSFSLSEDRTMLKTNGNILLKAGENTLEKYTFSNGIASSVKLGALESDLDRIVGSIEHISEDLKRGKLIKLTREDVLRKTGEIFAVRHVLNLSSDLLDTPDFYWDRESLETLYHATCAHLSISKRTRVMNEKLNHCGELLGLLSNHLNDKHHVRLEWFIIILIMIEVMFELLHFGERFIS
jgi:uncharacterized Rmd1/YagE family protein